MSPIVTINVCRNVDNAIVNPRSHRRAGHVSDTTPVPASGDSTDSTQENWHERYTGLQRTIAKRDERLTATTSELDALRAEHEAAQAELGTYRERDAAANAEETARQTYETLRARFEAPPPVPGGTNAPNEGWLGTDRKYAERERAGTSTGWPT